MRLRIRNLHQRLKNDAHISEVISGTLVAFVLKLLGAVLSFSFNVVLARLLGADGAGVYFLSLSIVVISSVISRIGLDNAMLRYVAVHAAHNEKDKVNAVYSFGMRVVVSISIVVSLCLFVGAPYLSDVVFDKHDLSEPLRWMSLSIMPFSVLNLQSESFRGLKNIRVSIFIQGIGVPLVGLMILFSLVQVFELMGAVFAYVISVCLTAIAGAILWRSSMKGYKCARFDTRKMLDNCAHLYGISLINRAVLPWAPIFLLGVWATNEDVGIYGAANRLALLVSFMLSAVSTITAPKFAELYSQRKMKELERTAKYAATGLVLFSSPILIAFIFAGDFVMKVYGDDFTKGAVTLAILAGGQFINASFGPVGYILTMSGHEKKHLLNTVASGVMLVASSVVLVPIYGANGAAVSSLLGILLFNVLAAATVRKEIGISVLPIVKISRL